MWVRAAGPPVDRPGRRGIIGPRRRSDMRQVRIAVGVAAAAVLAAGAIAWLARPAPVELDAALEKHRADADDRHARREQKVAEIQTAGTLDLLRVAGKAYRRHAELAKAPPTADDLRDAFAGLRSRRDGRPFVFLWAESVLTVREVRAPSRSGGGAPRP